MDYTDQVRDSPWMSVAKELAKCASSLNRTWFNGIVDLTADFSFHALHTESEIRTL